MRVIDLAELERLGEITLGRGKVISAKTLAHHPGEYPVYSSSTRGDGVFGRYGLYEFDEELLTWSVDGGGDIFHRTQHRFSITNVAGFLRINTKLIDYRYLYYLLRFKHSRADFDWTYKAHPSVLRRVYRDLPILPLEEQKRIARILDEADLVRKKTQALIDKYDELAQSLFLDMFGDPVTNPKGWEVKTIGRTCEMLDRLRRPITKKDRISGPYPYYGATGVLDYVDSWIFDEKLVLLGEDGARWGQGEQSAFLIEGKTWVNNHAHVMKPRVSELEYWYLIFVLNQLNLLPYVTGTTIPKLTQKALLSIPIPIPPIQTQFNFANRIGQIQHNKVSCEQTMNASNNCFNALLQRAFNGELTKNE